MSRIRVRISYRDAAVGVEEFTAYDHATRFADVMESLWSGQITEIAIESHCKTHGWEHSDDVKCDRCGDVADCTNDLERDHFNDFRLLCEECVVQIAEDRESECGCGSSCSRCTGIPAHGPL